ncbi:MAG: dihydroorotase [Clostridia bacterium]|nr:dihydroorotase [Clostridia bacterium]
MSILVRNGLVLKDGAFKKLDVYIDGDRIEKIGADLHVIADRTIEADGLAVLPGFVDMHCHLREPGFEYKEDIFSGTSAALQGGYTSVACMPNTEPVVDNLAVLKYVVDKAAEIDNCKVYPIAAVTKGQKGEKLTEMGKLKEAGAVAFSDDGRPVSDANMMRLALEYAKGVDALVISHCEDLSLAAGGVVNEGFNATIVGLRGITRTAEEVMVAREVLLAEALDCRVHIAHISTANSVSLVREAKKRGAKVTCETCPHYFSATDEEILSFNTNAKINPPLRTQTDVDAIIEGLKDGTIDAIATDHAPHHADEKNREFELAPNGTSGFETAFAVGYTFLVEAGHMSVPELVELMSGRPARILGIEGGEIREGAVADIAIIDLEADYVVDSSRFVSKGKNSVFNGWKLKGIPRAVIVNGYEKEIRS